MQELKHVTEGVWATSSNVTLTHEIFSLPHSSMKKNALIKSVDLLMDSRQALA